MDAPQDSPEDGLADRIADLVHRAAAAATRAERQDYLRQAQALMRQLSPTGPTGATEG